MTRRLAIPWISAFQAYTKSLGSPDIFNKWCGISCVAGVLERKVYSFSIRQTFPHLYVMLVAPPGIGKTNPLIEVEDLWRGLPDQHTAPSSLSKASLIDALHEADRRIVNPLALNPVIQFNSLKIPVKELTTFVSAYDAEMMGALTDIYDGGHYGDRKRTSAINKQIPKPQVNLLMATTPSYLNEMMPEGAWDQGFISRVNMVYSSESVINNFFQRTVLDEALKKNIAEDLKHISEISGEIVFSPQAAEVFNTNHIAGFPPQPDHPKLTHYLTRRSVHCFKLCMIASISRGDDMTVSLEDFQLAQSWMLEAEATMGEVFKTGGVGDFRTMEEVHHFCWRLWTKHGKPVPEALVLEFMTARTASMNVDRILAMMVKTNWLDKVSTVIGAAYKPVARLRK